MRERLRASGRPGPERVGQVRTFFFILRIMFPQQGRLPWLAFLILRQLRAMAFSPPQDSEKPGMLSTRSTSGKAPRFESDPTDQSARAHGHDHTGVAFGSIRIDCS